MIVSRGAVGFFVFRGKIMTAWWNSLSSRQKSGLISALGLVLAVIAEWLLPELQLLGGGTLAAIGAFAVNELQMALLKAKPGDSPAASSSTTESSPSQDG